MNKKEVIIRGGDFMKLLAYILLACNIVIFIITILDFTAYDIGEWLIDMLFFGLSIFFFYKYVSDN